MKTSELIEKLTESIKVFGDLKVFSMCGGWVSEIYIDTLSYNKTDKDRIIVLE